MDVIVWALKFLLAIMIAFPFLCAAGFSFIDHYFMKKRELHVDILKSQLAALKTRVNPHADE